MRLLIVKLLCFSLKEILRASCIILRGSYTTITTSLLNGLQGLHSEFEAFAAPEALSAKELEILRLIAAGCSNKEIADALFKSEGTVKNQVSAIMAKLGVRDRTRAVLRAIELGLIGFC